MNTIRQKAYRRQRVIFEVVKKGRSVSCAARLHGVSRMSVYRCMKRAKSHIVILDSKQQKNTS